MASFGNELRRAGSGIGGAAGGTMQAVGGAIEAIQAVVAEMEKFVAALSPSTVQILQQAYADLSATIGQAFLPALQEAAAFIRSIADQISPLMRALAPVFAQLADVVGGVMVSLFHGLADVTLALLPVFQAINDILRPVADVLDTFLGAVASTVAEGIKPFLTILQAWLPVLRTVLDAASDLTQGMTVVSAALTDTLAEAFNILMTVAVQPVIIAFQVLRPIINLVVDVLKDFVKGLIAASVFLLKLVGGDAALQNLLKSLQPREEGHVTAAGPVSMGDLQSITKDLALASAQAMGSGLPVKQDTADFAREIRDMIAQMQGRSLSDMVTVDLPNAVRTRLNDWWDMIWQNALGPLMAKPLGLAGEAGDKIREAVQWMRDKWPWG